MPSGVISLPSITSILYQGQMDHSKSGGTFTAADLGGSWTRHMLAAGDGSRWMRGNFDIDSRGLLTWASMERSSGVSTLPNPETLSLSADGIVSSASTTTLHGVPSQDKAMIIGTSTDEEVGTRYKIGISLK